MLILAIAALLPFENPAAAAPPRCQNDQPRMVGAAPRDRARPRRLGELPPADHVLTVLRSVDRCERPVIVRSGVGGR